jgi:hypothetical protein
LYVLGNWGREDWGKLVIVSHETQRMEIKSSYDVRIHLCIVKARADVKIIREISLDIFV